MTKRSADDIQNDTLKHAKHQSTMLKWMRDIPGPLNAIMKADTAAVSRNHDDFDGANLDASRITTCFDNGPWIDMCRFMNIGASSGELYGGIKLSTLKHTIASSLESDDATSKIEKLMVLIKSVTYTDEEIVARFHDPTGEVQGYFHRDLVKLIKPALRVGTGILLGNVSVLDTSMTRARMLSTRSAHCNLNIMSHNVSQVFVSYSDMDGSEISEVDLAVTRFHDSISSSSVMVEKCDSSESEAEELIATEMVQDTMREISFLSQRQVLQPNPPVRSNVAITEPSRSEKGQWNWSSLTKKPSRSQITDILQQRILDKIAVSAEIPPIESLPASINQSAENSDRSELSSELKPSQPDALALLNQELERDDW